MAAFSGISKQANHHSPLFPESVIDADNSKHSTQVSRVTKNHQPCGIPQDCSGKGGKKMTLIIGLYVLDEVAGRCLTGTSVLDG